MLKKSNLESLPYMQNFPVVSFCLCLFMRSWAKRAWLCDRFKARCSLIVVVTVRLIWEMEFRLSCT